MMKERVNTAVNIIDRERNRFCSDPDLLEIVNSMDAKELCSLSFMGVVFSHSDGKINGVYVL